MSPRLARTILIGTPLGLLLLVGAAFAARTWDGRQLEKSQSVGDSLVAALSRYHAANHHYPDSLVRLVPAQLAKVPVPSWGTKRWEYFAYQYSMKTPEGRGIRVALPTADSLRRFFELSLPGNPEHYPVLYFNSEYGSWVYDN